jgi:tetratricopeptide (TPR) repeat protein
MKFKYNPGFSSDEDLISAFVVRQIELKLILETLEENTGRTYQHLLLVGSRGTGKTMLVRRVAAEVRRSDTLKQNWYPLVFGEESYRILSAGEFWLEALCHLAAQNPDSKWQGIYEELRGEKDEKRLQQRSIANLMDFADERGQQILLIVENLNTLFDEQMSDDDGWDLRHTLQTEPRLMLLGTATGRFDEIDNVDKAWFEFFALYVMEPLKLAECKQLWANITDENLSEDRVRPMQILTGGNPRLLQVLAEFATGMSFRDLIANLTQLIDSHTNYFKSLLDNLPATERKVFVELLEIWEPASTNSIANVARMEVSKVSALLSRLLNRGAIELVEQPGKKKYYQVSERLFNIYYLMRKRGAPDNRVNVTVRFMAVFYPDLIEQIRWIVEEACNLPADARQDHLWALSSILKRIETGAPKEKILQMVPEYLQVSMNTKLETSKKSNLFPDGIESKEYRELTERFLLYKELMPELSNGNYDKLTINDKLIISGKLEQAGFNLNLVERDYRQAVNLNPEYRHDWKRLGDFYEKLGRLDDAKKIYLEAIKSEPKEFFGYDLLGKFLVRQNHLDDAESVYHQGIKNITDQYILFLELARLYCKTGKKDRAESIYIKICNLHSEKRFSWLRLGEFYEKNKQFESAEKTYRDAIDKNLHNDFGYDLLGRFYYEKNRETDATKVYKEGVINNPENPDMHKNLARFYCRSGRNEKAGKSYIQTIILKQPNHELWIEAFDFFSNHYLADSQWLTMLDLSKDAVDIINGEESEVLKLSMTEEITKFIIAAAAAGHADRALIVLNNSPAAFKLEPLIAGLRIFLGEKRPLVSKEIFEVGQDIVDRIRAKVDPYTSRSLC